MICKECGKEAEFHFFKTVEKVMRERELCFNCNFWYDKLLKYKNFSALVIDGCFYWRGDENQQGPKHWRGHGGTMFVWVWNNGIVGQSTNLWYNGKIPEHFRERMPDKARWS